MRARSSLTKVAGAIALWLLALAPLRAGWTLQSSERLATGSPAITLVRKTVANSGTAEIHAVFFNVKHCAVRVLDHPGAAGDLGSAMRANGCLAGVNGNYFRSGRASVGLVISDGRTLHPLERAKLLSGVLTASPSRFSLLRFAEFAPDAPVAQALQAGPFLVDRGEAVHGLEAARAAARTVVLADGKGAGALLVCKSVTLAEMAAILSTPGIISEMRVSRALNLDGGSSSGLWVDAAPHPFYLPENKNVRNYLALMLREK